MRQLIVDNYVIKASVLDVLKLLQLSLTNGKLKDIDPKSENILVTCPHHSGGHENTPACNIYIGDDQKIPYGFFRCFVCDEQGTFLKFVAECFGSNEDYAKKWLINNFETELIGTYIDVGEPLVLPNRKAKTVGLDPAILNQYTDWHPYLAKRKLSKKICNQFNVKYDPKYRQVIFPAYDIHGNLVMLTKRSIDTKTFYLDKDVEKPVYCLDYIMKHNIRTAIITEGPIDCLTCWEYGMPAIATFGRLSTYQIEQINKSCLNVLYLMFDNDTAGKTFTETLKKKLAKRILAIETKFPASKKDVNDLTKEEFEAVLKTAQD